MLGRISHTNTRLFQFLFTFLSGYLVTYLVVGIAVLPRSSRIDFCPGVARAILTRKTTLIFVVRLPIWSVEYYGFDFYTFFVMVAKFCVWFHFYHFTILHYFHIFNFWSVSFFEATSYLDNVCVVFFGSKVRAGDFHSNGSQSLAELGGWYREHRSSSPRAARLPRVPQLYLRHSSISCDNILCLGISTAASLRSISRCPGAFLPCQ